MTSPQPPATLQPYLRDMAQPQPGEQALADELSRVLLEIAQTTWENGGRALRSVHAKSHGLLKAQLDVLPDLPLALAQGLFARPDRYEALMRLSTTPGDLLPDNVSTPRGVALHVFGVDGERLEDDQDGDGQDFILVNGPTFNARDGEQFLRTLKPLAATTDRAERSKQALSAVLRATETVVEALGGQSATLKALGGHRATHPLGETYFSQLPIRYGDYVAKIQLAPVSDALLALQDDKLKLLGEPDALREAVIAHFREHGGEWELRVQLCVDPQTMPIDDPTVEWDTAISPFIAVARLTAAPQAGWSQARSRVVDDTMGFSPWHGLQAHRPLGELMRLRQTAYARSREFRQARNPSPPRAPRTLQDIPD